MEPQNNTNWGVPISIIVAGALIAGAVFFVNNGGSGTTGNVAVQNDQGGRPEPNVQNVQVTEDDYIVGNPNADVIFVEYSDLECPFCKTFHGTMNRVMDEYGRDGQVAWVYRHLPLAQLHSKAPKEAEASECAGELGGNDAFWNFINRVFEITPANNGLNLSQLPEIAEEIGLDREAFTTCLDSGKYAGKIQDSVDSAVALGITGTPTTVIITKDGQRATLPGAQPYAAVKAMIDSQL